MRIHCLKRCLVMLCSASVLVGATAYMPVYASGENLITNSAYVDDSGSYSTNEITIYRNSPLIYLLSLTEEKQGADEVRGDVNADGVFNIADVVMLQNYLVRSGSVTDWQAGDLCQDNKLDVFDLVIMKQSLQNNK